MNTYLITGLAVIIATQNVRLVENFFEKMNREVTTSIKKANHVGQETKNKEKWIWMEGNLDVDRFRNGDKIPRARNAEQWVAASRRGEPVWCYYYDDANNGKKYGKLYNWYAVNDARGLAPEGWHIPNYDELNEWHKSLGVDHFAMKKIIGTNDRDKKDNETNKIFNGLPGGYINDSGEFRDLGNQGYWWTSSPALDFPGADYNTARFQAWSFYMNYNTPIVFIQPNNMMDGYSVRCMKD
jgi:uncharacterized protein (TIGR02145 family)